MTGSMPELVALQDRLETVHADLLRLRTEAAERAEAASRTAAEAQVLSFEGVFLGFLIAAFGLVIAAEVGTAQWWTGIALAIASLGFIATVGVLERRNRRRARSDRQS